MLIVLRTVFLLIALAITTGLAPPDKSKPAAPPPRADGLQLRKWTIEDHERIALVFVPKSAQRTQAPVLFVFHGRGGSAESAADGYAMHKLWPQAIVVYMEALPTPGGSDPEGKKNAWQLKTGDQNDRDLKFFDAVLETLKKDLAVDERRIFAMGHSSGGSFNLTLWLARPDVFAAFAPSGTATENMARFTPKPFMYIAGKQDSLIEPELQQKTINAAKSLNGCEEKGKPWEKGCTLYTSNTGTPVVTYLYDGTHAYPEEARALTVKFFKSYKPAPSTKPPTRKPASPPPSVPQPAP